MKHPLRQLLMAALVVSALLFSAVAPAAAESDSSATGPSTAEEAVEKSKTDRDGIQKLRLRCRGRVNAEGTPGVLCKWRRPKADDAAVLTIERRGADGWNVIHTSDNLADRRHFDDTVEPGSRHLYRVRVHDAEGELVARSRRNAAKVPNPQLDRLRLSCESVTVDGANSASCAWTKSDDATSYELWRVVDRGERELAGTFGADEFTTIDETVADDATLARYRVLGKDDAGEIVAKSRIKRIKFAGGTAS